MDYNFSFVRGLSSLRKNFSVLTESNLTDFSKFLEDEYCFNTYPFLLPEVWAKLFVGVPNNYSKVKREWLEEIYKYYSPVGIEVRLIGFMDEVNIVEDV